MSESLYVATLPLFEVDGRIEGDLGRDLRRLEVEEDHDGLKSLVARFLAVGPRERSEHEDLLYLDGDVLDFGRTLSVSLGPAGFARQVFRGRVSALEARFEEGRAAEVCVSAEDALMDFRMTHRSRTYEAMSDAEIAEALASEHGLRAEVDAPGPTYDRVHQCGQSDLAFLRERARRVNAELWIAGDALHFQARDARPGSELTLVVGNDLVHLRVLADLAHQRTSVRVTGYDASDRGLVDEEAGEDVVRREIERGESGPALLERAFGERPLQRIHDVPLVAEEARAFAEAELLRRARSFVRAFGVTSGTPDLVVGSRLVLERAGAPFEGGGYRVTRVRHTWDDEQGHRTTFEAERPVIEERR